MSATVSADTDATVSGLASGVREAVEDLYDDYVDALDGGDIALKQFGFQLLQVGGECVEELLQDLAP